MLRPMRKAKKKCLLILTIITFFIITPHRLGSSFVVRISPALRKLVPLYLEIVLQLRPSAGRGLKSRQDSLGFQNPPLPLPSLLSFFPFVFSLSFLTSLQPPEWLH